MTKKFTKNDQYVGLSENKSIYRLINDLNIQYDMYYKEFPQYIKNEKGHVISKKLSDLLDMVVCLYFQKELYDNYSFINEMYLLLKQIEFHIKLLSKESVISKKQILALSSIMANLGNGLKERLNTYQFKL